MYDLLLTSCPITFIERFWFAVRNDGCFSYLVSYIMRHDKWTWCWCVPLNIKYDRLHAIIIMSLKCKWIDLVLCKTTYYFIFCSLKGRGILCSNSVQIIIVFYTIKRNPIIILPTTSYQTAIHQRNILKVNCYLIDLIPQLPELFKRHFILSCYTFPLYLIAFHPHTLFIWIGHI